MMMMLMCQLGLIGTAGYRVVMMMMMMMMMMMIMVMMGTSGSDSGSGMLMIGIVPKGIHLSLLMLLRQQITALLRSREI